MDLAQLHLFSQSSDMLAEGYQKLSAFEFAEAKSVFYQINETLINKEQDVETALTCTGHWERVFNRLEKKVATEKISYLFNQIEQFEFNNEWGFQKLRASLITHLIGLMQQQNLFYVNEQTAISDLYLQIGKHKMTERSITDRINAFPFDTPARFRLAQLQWNQKQKGSALRNYTLGLLIDPESAPVRYLECEQTSVLIQTHGPDMTPAYGWISGILPLLLVPETITPVSNNHRNALACYRLIRNAEKASKKKDLETCVELRKELKSGWPYVYQEYYKLISKRTQPSLY
jgi:hypothetical protein